MEDARKVQEPDFTIADLIGEISGGVVCDENLEPDPLGFYTTEEIAEITGLNVRRVRRVLLELKKSGNLEVGTKRVRLLNDFVRGIAAYRLVNWSNKDEGIRDLGV